MHKLEIIPKGFETLAVGRAKAPTVTFDHAGFSLSGGFRYARPPANSFNAFGVVLLLYNSLGFGPSPINATTSWLKQHNINTRARS